MRVVRDKTPGADVGVHVLRKKYDKSAQWWCPRKVRWHSRHATRLSDKWSKVGKTLEALVNLKINPNYFKTLERFLDKRKLRSRR